MPNGDNWQGDVLRDLRGGTPPQQPAPEQQQQQGAGDPGQQGAPAQGPAPAYGYPQQQAYGDPSAAQQQQIPQQGAPAQGPAPAYGYPQQQPYADPSAQYQQQAYPAQPQQAYAPQQQYAEQQQQQYAEQQRYAEQQQQYAEQQQYAARQQPQVHPQQAPAARRGTPDSRPVLDKRIASAALKPRRGEPFSTRALRAVRRTVASSAAREVADTAATAEVLQQAVTTGRQIAVTSIRGGSGKTTVAALLTATYSHYRQDPVLAVEADPALGSLPLRLGAETLRWTTGDLAGLVEPQMSLLDVTGYLVQLPGNSWLLPGSQGQVGAMLDTKGYERVMVALRRYFGVTVVDCETLPAEVARTALSAAQARVLTVPATLEGVASTRAVLEWMRNLPRHVLASTVVVLTEIAPHPGLDLDKATEELTRAGVTVAVLPYDRHLAAGGPLRTDLLARATRQSATRLAADVFQLSQKQR
ncbi:MinD/ParA family protein [Streptomyces sp. NPDC002589]|uniref:MinD/ParA family protein n=1 Tax=Streptomyces sp. NPDC002589 TaxID=3154420 RepID=UPI00332B82A2